MAPTRTIDTSGRLEAGHGERGFVLITVLFVLSFLALAAVTVSRAQQMNLALARNALANAEAEAFAETGVALAMLDLSGAAGDESLRRLPRDGTRFACVLPQGARLEITVSDEAGRIDLNQASEALLTALFSGLGLEASSAAAKAAAIADYRDADGETRPNGAERALYANAGQPGPKNAPFDTVGELAGVAGISKALAEKAMPYLTVHSAQDGVDPAFASPDLIAILERGAAATLALQDAGGLAGAASSSRLPVAFRVVSVHQAFAIFSLAVTAEGARFERVAVAGLRRAPSNRTRIASPAPSTDVDNVPARAKPRDDALQAEDRWEAYLREWGGSPARHANPHLPNRRQEAAAELAPC